MFLLHSVNCIVSGEDCMCIVGLVNWTTIYESGIL